MPNTEAFKNLNSRLSKRLEHHDSSSPAVKVLTLLERLERQAQALDDLRKARSPLDTVEAHARKVGKGAKRLEAESQRIHDTINSVVTEGYAALGEEITQRCNLIPSEYAGEIRATLRSMTEKERTAALNQALQDGDGPLIAAVCQSPGILSGLTAEVQQRYVQSLQEMKLPHLLAAMDDLSEALSVAEAARKAAEMQVDANYRADEQARIDAAEAAADEAQRVLAESLI